MKDLQSKTIFENYIIYTDGSVYSYLSNKYLKIQDNGNGYKKVSLRFKGHTLQKYVHRLVAEQFCIRHADDVEVDHIDRDKSNNNASNLRWVTASQNQSEMSGNRYRSPRKCRRYSEELRYDALKMYSNGWRIFIISDKLNIPRQTISTWIKSEGIEFGTCLL